MTLRLFSTFALFAILFVGAVQAQTVQDRLPGLRTGDGVVFDFRQSVTVVSVTAVQDQKIHLRIATATKDLLDREGLDSWLSWLHKGCKGAASDETICLRTDTVGVIRAEDQSKIAWLLTLMGLDLKKVPESMRRKAGPAPLAGELDLRHPWHPPIVVQGARLPCSTDAYTTCWPDDGSDLSCRLLVLYFPASQGAVQGFPYWIESPSSSYHVQVIDSTHTPGP